MRRLTRVARIGHPVAEQYWYQALRNNSGSLAMFAAMGHARDERAAILFARAWSKQQSAKPE
jgi:hypothetical protein